jgi:hypothetical protein
MIEQMRSAVLLKICKCIQILSAARGTLFVSFFSIWSLLFNAYSIHSISQDQRSHCTAATALHCCTLLRCLFFNASSADQYAMF